MDKIVWEDDGEHVFELTVARPDWEQFRGEVLLVRKNTDHPPSESGSSSNETPNNQGFDAWQSQFAREEEVRLVHEALTKAQQGIRVHIRGLSTRESLELVREYYADHGYEDALAKNYILPAREKLTVSVSLRHALWCEKDKFCLGENSHSLREQKTERNVSYEIVPPLRGSSDLRYIQQCLRMGIIQMVEVFPGDEIYLHQLLEREILTPHQISLCVGWNWERWHIDAEKIIYQIASDLDPL